MALDVQALVWPIIQIIWINVVLSGDNAVVIALACRSLPENQRRLGVALGTAAAIVLESRSPRSSSRFCFCPMCELSAAFCCSGSR